MIAVHAPTGFEVDGDTHYCYLEDNNHTHVATIEIVDNKVSVYCARNDYVCSIDFTDVEYDEQLFETINTTLFESNNWLVPLEIIEEIVEIVNPEFYSLVD